MPQKNCVPHEEKVGKVGRDGSRKLLDAASSGLVWVVTFDMATVEQSDMLRSSLSSSSSSQPRLSTSDGVGVTSEEVGAALEYLSKTRNFIVTANV